MTDNELYAHHAETIEAVIATVCRRARLAPQKGDELASDIRAKLFDNHCAVLRQFAGRSSMQTYLIAVAERVLHDLRNREWGKWRPCQEALRLGAAAIELDRLLTRDHLSYEEAVETLLARGVVGSRAELDEIRPKLAARRGRRSVGADPLEAMPATSSADEEVVRAERQKRAKQVAQALDEAIGELDPQEQLIIRLRYWDGFTVARIGLLIGEKAKPLYARFERLLVRLQKALAERGVTREEFNDLFGPDDPGEAAPLPNIFGSGGPRPSTRMTPGGRHA